MKTLKQFRVWVILATLVAVFSSTEKASAQVNVSVSFQTFYDQLSPYGYWMNTPDYGYVWQPNVATDFQPYGSNGYWIVTEYGNTWVSDYDWGWAPFHYGRWYFDNYYGWLWIPDTEWGPAWVSWRSGDGYYGWAPMGPGVNVSVSIPVSCWIFVPNVYITNRRFYDYCIPRTRVVHVYNHTTVINNYYVYNNRRYASGPSVRDIERHSHGRVQVYRVQHEDRPGRAMVSNGSVRVYRPSVSERRDNVRGPVSTGPGRRIDVTPDVRNRREDWGNSGRQDQNRVTTQPQNRSSERIGYPNDNRSNEGFRQPAEPQYSPRSREPRSSMESGRSDNNRQPSFDSNRQPSFDNNRQSDWGGRNSGSEGRTTQPQREQPQQRETSQPWGQPQERVQPRQREQPQFNQPSGAVGERRQSETQRTQWEQPQRVERSQPSQAQRQERIESHPRESQRSFEQSSQPSQRSSGQGSAQPSQGGRPSRQPR
ncbi:DUF6600 domain-containing protein [Xanthocytophaga agilis]|uniref:Uncharacterized protein n=1 Tax=Xanthocytophaga agilis TaxID=3048010 RepID=A0AAE3UHH9_9BACT|nr:DUF6600 domain-containing protein [Xanthocytophaga agilis]MDJ1506038.1 hypothetical protein [Xanthocytophaga agilis]